ncbi:MULTISPECIES: hypothetical protein [Pseudomonas]|uniref:Uncharacterized protein n=2 Tax=Pseudomonas TaxID=286 RepID=A0A7X3F449_9PSED|nr:hypothetical protein [Pseudomonas monteilii]
MLVAAQQQGPPMPHPSHLMILALAAAALCIYALASGNTVLALLAKPIPVLTLIAWLCSAPASAYRTWISIAAAPYLIILTNWLGQWAGASSVGHRSIDKVLTQSGARSAGSC